MALTAVTVTGRFLLSDNETAAGGSVTFKLSSPLQHGDVIVAATAKKVRLDEDGAFTVVLVATDDVGVTPAGATYLVTESIKHADSRSYSIELPHTDTTVDLADVAPVSDVDLVRYVLASTFQAHATGTAAHTAAHVSFTPPEGMDATNVQAAIEELEAAAPSGTSVPVSWLAASTGVTFSAGSKYPNLTYEANAPFNGAPVGTDLEIDDGNANQINVLTAGMYAVTFYASLAATSAFTQYQVGLDMSAIAGGATVDENFEVTSAQPDVTVTFIGYFAVGGFIQPWIYVSGSGGAFVGGTKLYVARLT